MGISFVDPYVTKYVEGLLNNQKPLVLFLRSLRDDEILDGRWGKPQHDPEYPSPLIPQKYPSIEDELKNVLEQCVGPVLKLGGANQWQVWSENWHEAVAECAARASLIVMNVGDGPNKGLRWELDHVLHRIPPHRFVFFVPVDREVYERFRRLARKYFPHLPSYGGAGFIAFSDTWSPTFLPLSRGYSLRDAFTLALQPVFERNGCAHTLKSETNPSAIVGWDLLTAAQLASRAKYRERISRRVDWVLAILSLLLRK